MKKVKGIGIGEAGNKIYKPHSKPKVEEHPKQKNLKKWQKSVDKREKIAYNSFRTVGNLEETPPNLACY